MTMEANTIPSSNVDLFREDVLDEPYDAYRELRNQGGVVWLDRYGVYALPRYDTANAALADDKTFISGEGVCMNDQMNSNLKGITLCSDGDEHMAMRKVIAKPLSPAALKELTEAIQMEAKAVVERLIERRSFDGVTDLAQHLPVTIVSRLVGLPEQGREQMLKWSAANFNSFGPINTSTLQSFEIVKEMIDCAFTQCVPGKLTPDGWAQGIWDAADRGEIRHDQAPGMMNDYMGPSLDTTISATSNLIVQFAENPDQWELLREKPTLLPNAINESVRLDSPIQAFTRYVSKDTELCGYQLKQGWRVMTMYASANRDERHYNNPERFDIERQAQDHIGFGFGAHHCVGSNLARLEMISLFRELIPRVSRWHVGVRKRAGVQLLRLYKSLEVSVELA
jgi:cytochrome P450